MRVSGQTTGTRTAIVRRAEEAHEVVSKASFAKALDVAREQFELVLTAQATDSAKHGASAGALAVGIAVADATHALVVSLHETVPDLAKDLPTSIKVHAKTDGVEAIEGAQFHPAVVSGIEGSFSLQISGADNISSPGEGLVGLSTVVTNVFGVLRQLARNLVDTNARNVEEHAQFVREASEHEDARSGQYAQALAELEQGFSLRTSQLEEAVDEKLEAISDRFVRFIDLLDESTKVDLADPGVLIDLMRKLAALKRAGNELMESVTRDLSTKADSTVVAPTVAAVTSVPAAEAVAPVRSEATELDGRLQPLRAEEARLGAALPPLRAERAELEGVLPALRAESIRLNEQLPGLRTESERLGVAIEGARASGAQADVALRAAEESLAGRVREVYGREQQADARDSQLTARAEGLDSREQSLTDRSGQLDARSGVLDTRESTVADRESKVGREENLARELADVRRELEEARRALDAARAATAQAGTLATVSTLTGPNTGETGDRLTFNVGAGLGNVVKVIAPDGTSSLVSPDAAGNVNFVPTQVGRHTVMLLATATSLEVTTTAPKVVGPTEVSMSVGDAFVPVSGRSDIRIKVTGYTPDKGLGKPASVVVTLQYGDTGKDGTEPFKWTTSSGTTVSDGEAKVLQAGARKTKRDVTVAFNGGFDTTAKSTTLSIKVDGPEIVDPATKAAAPTTAAPAVDMAPVTKLVADLKPIVSGITVRLGAQNVPEGTLDAIESEVTATDFVGAKAALIDKLAALAQVAIDKAGADKDGTEQVISSLRSGNGDSKLFVGAYVIAFKAVSAALYDAAMISDDDNRAVESVN